MNSQECILLEFLEPWNSSFPVLLSVHPRLHHNQYSGTIYVLFLNFSSQWMLAWNSEFQEIKNILDTFFNSLVPKVVESHSLIALMHLNISLSKFSYWDVLFLFRTESWTDMSLIIDSRLMIVEIVLSGISRIMLNFFFQCLSISFKVFILLQRVMSFLGAFFLNPVKNCTRTHKIKLKFFSHSTKNNKHLPYALRIV